MATKKEMVATEFEGDEVEFNRVVRGQRLTDEQVEALKNGEEITVEGLKAKSGSTYSLKGKLGWGSFVNNEGKEVEWFGFQGELAGGTGGGDKVTGKFRGKDVEFYGSAFKHKFTDAEIKTLLDGGIIEFEGTRKDGSTFAARGRLGDNEWKGKTTFGFVMDYTTGKTVTGEYQGREVTFVNEFCRHKFTDDEVETLLAGGTIEFEATKKNGDTFTARGHLGDNEWKGRKTFGFVIDYDS